jgi:hypothetical protein
VRVRVLMQVHVQLLVQQVRVPVQVLAQVLELVLVQQVRA